ncbi:MAG: inositol 2-dehydrogenase [Calditrichia bacterium]
MKTLNIGVIGLGSIAQIIHLQNLKKMMNVEVVGICDIDDVKAMKISKKFKIPNFFSDPEEMINALDLDGLMVLTSTNLHYPILSFAAKKGIPTFIERPPFLNIDEYYKAKKLMENADTFIQIGTNQRFDQDFILLKSILEKEELGEIVYANLGWLQALKSKLMAPWQFSKNIAGGGVIYDLGFVLIDLLLWFLPNAKVKCVKANLSNKKLRKSVEDFGSIYLTFDNGTTAVIEVSWDNVHPEDKFFMKFYGTKGYASYPHLKFYQELHGRIVNLTPEKSSSKHSFKSSYYNEINYFLNAIRGKVQPAATIEEYEAVYKVLDAIDKSSRSGKEIHL